MSESSLPSLPAYERPPVVERVVSVWADVTQEKHESRFEEWRSLVEPAYPVYEPLKEWTLQVQEVEGVPLLNDIKPALKITPRFSRKSAKDGFDWSIRCPAGQFTMNMHSEPGSPRRFSHLQKEFQHWFPLWMKHFEVKTIHRIQLLYINRLNRHTIPQFTQDNGSLEVDKVLTVFTQIPGEHEMLVPPLDCRATVVLPEPPGAKLEIRLHDRSKERADLSLDLRIQHSWEGQEAPSIEELAQTLETCHRRIVERFEVLFTQEARQSFGPINP